MKKRKKRNGRVPLEERMESCPPGSAPDFDVDEITDAYGICLDKLKKTTSEWVEKTHEALERLERAEKDP